LLVKKKKAISDAYIFIRIEIEEENFLDSTEINTSLLIQPNYKSKIIGEIYSKFTSKYKGIVSGFAYYTDIIDPATNQPWFSFDAGSALIKKEEVNGVFIQDRY
jgi:hydrogenase maturation factor